MTKRILFAILLLLIIFVAASGIVKAQGLPPGYVDTVTVAPAQSGYLVTTLGTVITSAVKWVAYVSGIFLFIYLVWGGSEWILSGGDKSKVEAGRTRITQSIIGFAILAAIFVGYGLVLDFLGLRGKVGIGNIGGGGAPGTVPGTGGNPGTGGPPGGGGTAPTATACANNVAVGARVNDGGSGGYCSSGAAIVRCMAVGTGTKPVSNVAYYDPCSCVNGSAAQNPAFIFGCTP